MKNPWVQRWDITGSRGDTWIVGQRADGTFGCSCPRWKFSKAPKADCKHIVSIREDLDTVTVYRQVSKIRPGAVFDLDAVTRAIARPEEKTVTVTNGTSETMTIRRRFFRDDED